MGEVKIVQIGRQLVNLDKIVMIDLNSNKLYLENEIEIELTGQELEQFVKDYNYMNTDERELLLDRVARVVLSNPEYLTKEGIQEQVTTMVKYHELEEYFKELAEGVKLKDIPLTKLVVIYKKLQEKIQEIRKGMPY